jgi:hypothetical protein
VCVSVTGVPHFHQGMGQKLAVSPTHGLHQNMAFNCGRKPKETTRNKKELAKISSSWIISFFLWYPLISFDFPRFPSVSFGFGFRGKQRERKIQGKDEPIKESL